MKTRYIVLALLCASVFGAGAKSPKRGVSENQFSMGSMLEALEPGVSWYYNWGNTPGSGYQNQVIDFEGIEFVPMCWNANYNADAIRDYCKSHPQTKYLLGFNEPNFTAQANMTPQAAAEAWPAVKALADELGLKLVAPALNYSPNPPYTSPTKWMDEFVALVGKDAFDYTAIHNYGGLGVMQTLATTFHERYGKDVWVTEFCLWPNEGNQNDYVSPETQIDSMVQTLQWLETTPWIYRYAWFKALGNSSSNKGPNYGLLVHEGTGTDPWTLSEQGKVYVGMGEFNADEWHPVGKTVAAADYTDASTLSLGSTADNGCGSIIEISRFNAGASAMWQFDVPQAGDYIVTLSASGFGEPTRFDPLLQWVLITDNGEQSLGDSFRPGLPNNDKEYVKIISNVTLPSGRVKLGLKDMAPYQPSGIRISSIRLDDAAGVDEVTVTDFSSGKIFNLQGICVGKGENAFESLPAGLYIMNGKKIIKK